MLIWRWSKTNGTSQEEWRRLSSAANEMFDFLADIGWTRRGSYSCTVNRPLSLRPKTSGKNVSSACAGATKKSPVVVARA